MKLYILMGSTDPQCGGGGQEVLIISTDKELIEKYEKLYNEAIHKALFKKGPWPEESLDQISVEEYETDIIPKWLLKLENKKKTRN